MSEYIPDGYMPPIYDIHSRWEIIAYTAAVVFALKVIFDIMMGIPMAADFVLVGMGAWCAFYYGRKMVQDFLVDREIKKLTEGS